MIRGVHHIAINTAALDRMVAFYRDTIGLRYHASGEWRDRPEVDEVVGLAGTAGRKAMLSAGNCFVELFEYSAPAARDSEPLRPCDRGYTHLCLDVTDIESEFQRLSEAGMRFNSAPRAFGAIRSAYGTDPDGNIVEIQEITSPDHYMAMSNLDASQLRSVSRD